MNKPFIITIDTEGDNLWNISDLRRVITTENAKYLFHFQILCEKYGFIPTYLTNYEMAKDEVMQRLGREGLKRGTLEIGAHEHAWNQPPIFPLVKRLGKRGKAYLGEYPGMVQKKKLEYLTKLLEDTFQSAITSHRGGRWFLSADIVDYLSELGYIADCTCSPGIDWSDNPGWSFFSKGTDWSHHKSEVYFFNACSDSKSMLEVPVSIIDIKKNGYYSWLRPNLSNKLEMRALLDYISDGEVKYAEFMLHSSELMPGGSPTFDNVGKVEKLYRDLEDLFAYAKGKGFYGIGLSDFARKVINGI